MTDIAIVGGGAAGAALFGELLGQRRQGRLHWVAGAGVVPGRGVAYATASEQHLLNVRASDMGLLAAEREEFLHFAASRRDPVDGADFLPRGLFGDFIEARLRECTEQALARGRQFDIHADDACQIEPLCSGGYVLRMAGGALLKADAVVLALGALPQRPLKSLTRQALASGAYQLDPWQLSAREPAPQRVLVIGTGLTAVDALLSAAARWPQAQLLAVSRHGLFPFAHPVVPPAPYAGQAGLNRALLECDAVLPMLQRVRAAVADPGPHDWHGVIDGMRPIHADLWQRLALPQRRRFLRHLRWIWEAARHRSAPAAAEALAGLRAEGRLQVVAARVLDIDGNGPLTVRLRRRADQRISTHQAERVIQATGLDTAVAYTGQPLLARLLRDGMAVPDPLQLGIAADRGGQLLDARGEPQTGLFALGSLLRGCLWECTAMPEIRSAAARLARQLAESEPLPTRGRSRPPVLCPSP